MRSQQAKAQRGLGKDASVREGSTKKPSRQRTRGCPARKRMYIVHVAHIDVTAATRDNEALRYLLFWLTYNVRQYTIIV